MDCLASLLRVSKADPACISLTYFTSHPCLSLPLIFTALFTSTPTGCGTCLLDGWSPQTAHAAEDGTLVRRTSWSGTDVSCSGTPPVPLHLTAMWHNEWLPIQPMPSPASVLTRMLIHPSMLVARWAMQAPILTQKTENTNFEDPGS